MKFWKQFLTISVAHLIAMTHLYKDKILSRFSGYFQFPNSWDIWRYVKLSTSDIDVFSRFDLIYLILDKANEETDRRLAKHIVALHFENPNVWTFSLLFS